VSGVTVLVYPFNGPTGLGNAVTTVTDASGKYNITFNSLLTPGGDLPVPVQTEKSGYESYRHHSGPIGCVLRDPSTNACRPVRRHSCKTCEFTGFATYPSVNRQQSR
jgi:hypothetical protein